MSDRFYKLPSDIAARRDLTASDKLVYAIICDRIGENGKCWPGNRRLAEDVGIDKDTASACVERLKNAGLIKVDCQGRGFRRYISLPLQSDRKIPSPTDRKTQSLKNPKCPNSAYTGDRKTQSEVTEKPSPNYKDPLNNTYVDNNFPNGVFIFPTIGDPDYWGLTESKLVEYRQTFPHLDVDQECRKARQWCVDNPAKRKTAKGMPRFLSGWLSRAGDKSKNRFSKWDHKAGNDFLDHHTSDLTPEEAAALLKEVGCA